MHVFVRHAPLPHMEGICYGRLDAVPDAAAWSDAIGRLAGILPPYPMVTSPSTRCATLARALHAHARARGHDASPLRIDERLREMDFGDWEGLRWDAIPRASIDAWNADLAGHAPPGGESFAQLIERVGAALDALDRPHVVVTHAGVVRAAHCLAGMPHAQAAAIAVPHLQPILVDQAGRAPR
jgi:alpha-ribazole phosphatase